jgi:hypothetical protein
MHLTRSSGTSEMEIHHFKKETEYDYMWYMLNKFSYGQPASKVLFTFTLIFAVKEHIL